LILSNLLIQNDGYTSTVVHAFPSFNALSNSAVPLFRYEPLFQSSSTELPDGIYQNKILDPMNATPKQAILDSNVNIKEINQH
jgi:hypothetical protein